jgi:hypothetical protein
MNGTRFTRCAANLAAAIGVAFLLRDDAKFCL